MSSAASLLNAMEDTVEADMKFALKVSVLSTIMEDKELVEAFSDLKMKKFDEMELTLEMVRAARAKAKAGIRSAVRMISHSQTVSICFLLDITGSMGPYIVAVKEQINQIVDMVSRTHAQLNGIAFVGYRDWDHRKRFEILDFTEDVSYFRSFLADIEMIGGCDIPEDVNGGLRTAIRKITWPNDSGTRILFHIGDAPPHGHRFHNFEDDNYPHGHDKDVSLPQLFNEMKRKNILYYFGKVGDDCDGMIRVFEEKGHYGSKIDVFDAENVSTISDSVVESVMRSVSLTSAVAGAGMKKGREIKYTIDPEKPDWGDIHVIKGTAFRFLPPTTIEDIVNYTPLEKKYRSCFIKMAKSPFAKGSVRLAYYGKEIDTKDSSERQDIVLKKMMKSSFLPAAEKARYYCDIETLAVSKKLADDFTAALKRSSIAENDLVQIDFLKAATFRYKFNGKEFFLCKENQYWDGEMTKLTNNWTFERTEGAEAAVAFSHFTHSVTGGYLLVCDLQGIKIPDSAIHSLLLTDPAIHCDKHFRFGQTNLGKEGMDAFFSKHECNKYCRALGLR